VIAEGSDESTGCEVPPNAAIALNARRPHANRICLMYTLSKPGANRNRTRRTIPASKKPEVRIRAVLEPLALPI
jgi:hypothetical protein